MENTLLTKKRRALLVTLGHLPKVKALKGRTMVIRRFQQAKHNPWGEDTPASVYYEEVPLPKTDPGERLVKRKDRYSCLCRHKHIFRRNPTKMNHVRLCERLEYLNDFSEQSLVRQRLAMFVRLEIQECLGPIADAMDRLDSTAFKKHAQELRRLWKIPSRMYGYRSGWHSNGSDTRTFAQHLRDDLAFAYSALVKYGGREALGLARKLELHYDSSSRLNSHELALRKSRRNHPETQSYADAHRGPPPDQGFIKACETLLASSII